jgi:hypothetical protein
MESVELENVSNTFSNDSELALAIFKSPLTSICMSVRVHAMDLPPTWSQACICGHVFSVPQAYSCHKCSCEKSKKQLSGALERAKEVWQVKKCRKVEVGQSGASDGLSNQNHDDALWPSGLSPVEVLDDVCVHPQVRLSIYQQHHLLRGSSSECRDLHCEL